MHTQIHTHTDTHVHTDKNSTDVLVHFKLFLAMKTEEHLRAFQLLGVRAATI